MILNKSEAKGHVQYMVITVKKMSSIGYIKLK